jgi:acylphosphatase
VMSQPSAAERRVVHYRGTVQGVGFRYTTRRIAARFRVTGYVQNLADGRVLVVAEGQGAELDRFFAAVMQDLGRYVDDAAAIVRPAENHFSGFEIRF